MILNNQLRLRDWDILLLDAHSSLDLLSLLRGRLCPGTRILIQASEQDEELIRQTWSAADRETAGFWICPNPPGFFLDPGHKNADSYSLDFWPNEVQAMTMQSEMPSGRPWPKISVVTVTLNQAEYLEETLRSVLMQGYPNLEYIVVDGKSTDGTPDILARYRDALAYCVSEEDEGQSDALNKAFALSTGEILAWLNSDDRYLPETLLRVALAFDTYRTDIVAGGCALTRNDSREIYKIHHNSFPVGRIVPFPVERLLDVDGSWLKGDFFWQPEVFWTRKIWERCGGRVARNLYYCMDYDLWVRMAQNGARIVHIPDTLAVFRFHDAQKSSGEQVPYLPELREVSGAYLKALR